MSEIRNNPGQSSYFQGKFQGYGRYQWNIKYYGFNSDSEIEAAQLWAFGEYLYSKGQFDYLNEVIGRPVKASIQGRSGGWLVIDTELTDAELKKVDKHVKDCLKGLPMFLKEERQVQADFEADAMKQEHATREKLTDNGRVKQVCKLIRSIAGQDAVLVMHGITIDLETGNPRE